jgi:hypothetical protein
MPIILLTTVLNCSQVLAVVNRLQSISMLTPKQKTEILIELHKSVPTCPILIKKDDQKTKGSN